MLITGTHPVVSMFEASQPVLTRITHIPSLQASIPVVSALCEVCSVTSDVVMLIWLLDLDGRPVKILLCSKCDQWLLASKSASSLPQFSGCLQGGKTSYLAVKRNAVLLESLVVHECRRCTTRAHACRTPNNTSCTGQYTKQRFTFLKTSHDIGFRGGLQPAMHTVKIHWPRRLKKCA